MGFDVADSRALGAADAVQSADLIVQQVLQLLRRVGHGASTKAGEVLIRGVGADFHIMGQRQTYGFAHDARVACVKTAGNVGAINKRHDLGIQAHGPAAKTLTNIAIQ